MYRGIICTRQEDDEMSSYEGMFVYLCVCWVGVFLWEGMWYAVCEGALRVHEEYVKSV